MLGGDKSVGGCIAVGARLATAGFFSYAFDLSQKGKWRYLRHAGEHRNIGMPKLRGVV